MRFRSIILLGIPAGTTPCGGYSAGPKSRWKDMAEMSHVTPWYIITGDEIEEIWDRLHSLRSRFSTTGIENVREIENLLITVRDRRP